MAVYPPHGLPDWDDELKIYIDATAAESATTDADVAAFVSDPGADTHDAVVALVSGGANDAAVAGFVGDTGSLTYDAISDLIEEIAGPALPVFPVDSYGAVGDGTTNDDAAFAAAKAAATAAGGGWILLGPHRYRIDSVFFHGEGNSLRAPMASLEAPNDKYCIVLGSSTAQVQLGGDAQGRGGTHGNFNIDANSTGASPALRCTVNDQVVAPITVQNAPAIGYSIFASQNSKFIHPTADNCQDNIVVDGGSGGLTIENLHSTSPTRYGLRIYDSNPGGHAYGYQYGCADILFIKPLVEQYANTCTNLVRIQSGSRIKFEQPGFSVNTQSVSGNAIVHIDNDDFAGLGTVGTEVEFSSGNYHGGVTALEKIFYVKGTNTFTGNKVVVNGQSFFQQSAAIFSTDGATIAALDEEQWYIAPTVAAVFDPAIPASALFFWRKTQRTGVVFSMEDSTGAWSGHNPIAVRRSSDSTAGSRFLISRDGILSWADGTNNVGIVTATPDTTNKFLAINGLKMTGKKVTSLSLSTVSAAGTSLALDVSTISPVHIISLTSVGTITTWTLTNPVDGQEIELWITRAGAQTFVWPTNISWENDVAPLLTPTAGKYMKVFLKYTASGTTWWEHKKRVLTADNPDPVTHAVINTQTGTSYTLVLADDGKFVTMSNASASTLTVPPNSSVAFKIGTKIEGAQLGAGQVTLTPGAGVTINASPGLKVAAQYGTFGLIKLGTDTWLAYGRLST